MATGKTISFTGKGQAGNLQDPNNWAHGAVPGVNDTALITMNTGGPETGTFSVNNIMLLGNETITFQGTVNTAGVGACKGMMVCDGATVVFAPGAVLNDSNVLIVGNEAAGTFDALGLGATHSIINTAHANIGKHTAGVGSITIDDGVWTNSGRLVIGDAGSGTVNVIDHGVVNAGGDVDMAASAGATGKLTIASGGSVTVAEALCIGGAAPGHGTASVTVGAGASLTVDQTLLVGTGSELDIASGTVTGGALADCIRTLPGGVISGFGTLSLTDGMAIDDGGIIRASGGSLEVDGNVCGTGSIQIGANSTADLTGNKLGLVGISFIGPNATLSLAHGAAVGGQISGFALGDIIAMANVDAVSFNAANGVLTLSDQGLQVDRLHLAGSFTGDTFSVHQSAAGALIALQHA